MCHKDYEYSNDIAGDLAAFRGDTGTATKARGPAFGNIGRLCYLSADQSDPCGQIASLPCRSDKSLSQRHGQANQQAQLVCPVTAEYTIVVLLVSSRRDVEAWHRAT